MKTAYALVAISLGYLGTALADSANTVDPKTRLRYVGVGSTLVFKRELPISAHSGVVTIQRGGTGDWMKALLSTCSLFVNRSDFERVIPAGLEVVIYANSGGTLKLLHPDLKDISCGVDGKRSDGLGWNVETLLDAFTVPGESDSGVELRPSTIQSLPPR